MRRPVWTIFRTSAPRELHIVPSSTIALRSKANSVRGPMLSIRSTWTGRHGLEATLNIARSEFIKIRTLHRWIPNASRGIEFFQSPDNSTKFVHVGSWFDDRRWKISWWYDQDHKRWYEALYFGPVELFSHTNEKAPFLPALWNFLLSQTGFEKNHRF